MQILQYPLVLLLLRLWIIEIIGKAGNCICGCFMVHFSKINIFGWKVTLALKYESGFVELVGPREHPHPNPKWRNKYIELSWATYVMIMKWHEKKKRLCNAKFWKSKVDSDHYQAFYWVGFLSLWHNKVVLRISYYIKNLSLWFLLLWIFCFSKYLFLHGETIGISV